MTTPGSLAALLDVDGSVTLDGSGYGVVRLAPAGEKWEVRRTRTECSTATNEATVKVYRNQVAPRYVIDGTYSGSTGDTSDTVYYLEDGQAVIIEWSGGDPGATATVTLSGWRSEPSGGFRAIH